MLLKSGSKKARSGFQRKKLGPLGGFKEIISGQKKAPDGSVALPNYVKNDQREINKCIGTHPMENGRFLIIISRFDFEL